MTLQIKASTTAGRTVEAILRTMLAAPEEIAGAHRSIAQKSIERLQQYPAESDANRPPPPYYERGIGQWRPSRKWSSGYLSKLSEQMNTRWEYETRSTQDSVETSILNRASYSGYVHGDGDGEGQVPWHAKREWPIGRTVIAGFAGDAEISVQISAGDDEFETVAEQLVKLIESG